MCTAHSASVWLAVVLMVGCGEESAAGDAIAPGIVDAALVVVVRDAASSEASVQADASVDAGEADFVDAASTRVDLVRHALWTRVQPAQDPFADAPAVVDCPNDAALAQLLGEDVVFDVDTGMCNYLTVEQPALAPIAVGELIRVRLWHFELSAPEPAEAHALVSVDGLSVLDERVAIPGPGGLLLRELRVTRAVPAGAPILFHLHNHGANSWALVEISKS